MERSNNERRSEIRHASEWPVYLRSGEGKTRIGEVADISLSGIRVILNDSVEIGSVEGAYDLYICSVQSPMDLMNISGRAVWSEEKDHSLIIGLELANLSGNLRNMLAEYIEHQDSLALQMDLEM